MAFEVRRALDRIPYAKLLGVEAELRGESLLVRLPFQDSLVGNPVRRTLHGGVIGGFLETVGILAVWHATQDLSWVKTMDVTLSYLRVGKEQDTEGRAFVVRRGRRLVHVRTEAWQEEGTRFVATMSGNFLIGGSV